jgi:hypothetical protein
MKVYVAAMNLDQMSEAEWQGQVIELAHLLGWKHNHTRRSIGKGHKWVTATSVIGWPDLTLWHEAQHRILFVELKTEKGKLTAEQVAVLKSLAAAGAEVYVWRPSDLADVQERLSP